MDPSLQTPQPPQSAQPEGDIVDKVSRELKLELPGSQLPVAVRLIAFFTLIGGLGIIGSLLTDIIDTHSKPFYIYLIRLVVGFVAIVIAYGIIERKRWSIWLYGVLVYISIAVNYIVAILPLAVVIYLIYRRNVFTPSVPDMILGYLVTKAKNILRGKQKSI